MAIETDALFVSEEKMRERVIKFSETYTKIPKVVLKEKQSMLLACFEVHYDELHKFFIDYDTEFEGGQYRLPNAPLIVLLLKWDGILWTTIRRYTREKWEYYKNLEGETFEILIEPDGI